MSTCLYCREVRFVPYYKPLIYYLLFVTPTPVLHNSSPAVNFERHSFIREYRIIFYCSKGVLTIVFRSNNKTFEEANLRMF